MIVKSQVSSMIVKFESKLSAWITKFNDQSLYHCPQKTKLKTGAKHNQTLNDVGLDVHSVDVFFRSSHVALSQCKVQSSHTALQKNDMWVSIIQKLVLVFIWFWIIGLSTVRVARIKKSSNAWLLRFQAFLSAPVESSLAKRWHWQEAAILEPWPTNKNNSALSQCLTKLTIIISHSHSATPWRQTLLQFYFGPRNGISVCARCLIQGSRFWKPIAIIERIWKDKILIDDNVDSSVFSVLPCSKHRTLSTWQPVAFQTMMHKINEICVWKICC